MAKILSFDFEYDHDYTLIGIHSSMEDYRMAFFLNKALSIHLKRFDDDLDFEFKKCSFSMFEFVNKKTQNSWYLLSNKFIKILEIAENENLLFNNESQVSYLIPEKKKVDYFLKITGQPEESAIQEILSEINKIYQVITAYLVDPYQLKSRDHLIF